MNDPRPAMISARPSDRPSRVENAWYTRTGSSDDRTVTALAEVDIGRMRKLLLAFGDYLRASFDFANSDRLVPLRKELDLVRAYLYIEKERFGDRVQVEWEGSEQADLLVPPLSVQPLAENAVRHGLLRRTEGGTVRIRIRDLGDASEIAVEDDGVGMEPDTVRRVLREEPIGRKAGIGLANTDRRLKQIYGQGLRIRSEPGQGTAVSFVVRKESGRRNSPSLR